MSFTICSECECEFFVSLGRCPHCGKKEQPKLNPSVFCNICGFQITVSSESCQNCVKEKKREKVREKEKFCTPIRSGNTGSDPQNISKGSVEEDKWEEERQKEWLKERAKETERERERVKVKVKEMGEEWEKKSKKERALERAEEWKKEKERISSLITPEHAASEPQNIPNDSNFYVPPQPELDQESIFKESVDYLSQQTNSQSSGVSDFLLDSRKSSANFIESSRRKSRPKRILRTDQRKRDPSGKTLVLTAVLSCLVLLVGGLYLNAFKSGETTRDGLEKAADITLWFGVFTAISFTVVLFFLSAWISERTAVAKRLVPWLPWLVGGFTFLCLLWISELIRPPLSAEEMAKIALVNSEKSREELQRAADLWLFIGLFLAGVMFFAPYIFIDQICDKFPSADEWISWFPWVAGIAIILLCAVISDVLTPPLTVEEVAELAEQTRLEESARKRESAEWMYQQALDDISKGNYTSAEDWLRRAKDELNE